MNFKLIGGIFGVIIIVFCGFFALKNNESKAGSALNKKQDIIVSKVNVDGEEKITFESVYFKMNTDGALTIMISNHPKADCDYFTPRSHKEDEMTIHINLFNKNKEPLKTGPYERESDYSLGPEIISKETTHLFNGASIGSVDVATLDYQEEYMKGYIDLDDSHGMKIEGQFEAVMCR